MKWLDRLRPARKPASNHAPAPVTLPLPPVEPETRVAIAGWLFGSTVDDDAALAEPERRALARLDAVLAAPALPPELLPRTAALVPQLLAMLRQTELPVPALSQRIARDALLTAELLRVARSAYYRERGEVADLGQAIVLIGVDGVQRAIARVLLKPIFDAAPGPLAARAGTRPWAYAEALAQQAADEARAAGVASFDGYVAGLLHGIGWTIAARILDRAAVEPGVPFSAPFAAAFDERAHRLFGRAARAWEITPAFAAFAADAAERPGTASADPLAAALQRAAPQVLAALAAGA